MSHKHGPDLSAPHASTPKRHTEKKRDSSSSSDTDTAKGPTEQELKMLRAKFRTRFHRFTAGLTGGDKAGQVRIKTSDRAPTAQVKPKDKSSSGSLSTRSARALEFEPTIFEPVEGGFKPAKVRMRVRKMFVRERKKKRTVKKDGEDSHASEKKTKSPQKSIMQNSEMCEREMPGTEKQSDKQKRESQSKTSPKEVDHSEKSSKEVDASSKTKRRDKDKKQPGQAPADKPDSKEDEEKSTKSTKQAKKKEKKPVPDKSDRELDAGSKSSKEGKKKKDKAVPEKSDRDLEASSKSTKEKKKKEAKTKPDKRDEAEKSNREVETSTKVRKVKKEKPPIPAPDKGSEATSKSTTTAKEPKTKLDKAGKKEKVKEAKHDREPKSDKESAVEPKTAKLPSPSRSAKKPSPELKPSKTQHAVATSPEPQALPSLEDIDVHTAMYSDGPLPASTPQRTPTSQATSPIKQASKETLSAESTDSPTTPGATDSLRLHKSKEALFEKLDEDIVLDDKVLQDIAKDLKKGVAYENKLIDDSMARKLLELDNKTVSEAELKKITEQAYEQDETAMKIVDALTTPQVLGQVLGTDESKVLSDYFSGNRPQDEQVLNVLNVALEKILDRSHEFYPNKEELKRFLEHRDRAKMRLLDALLSRNTSFLRSICANAYLYADMISRGLKGAYELAGWSIGAAQEGYKYTAAVASDSYDKLCQSAAVARDLAQKSQEAVNTAKERVEVAAAFAKGWMDAAVNLVSPSASPCSSLRGDAPECPSSSSSASSEGSSECSSSSLSLTNSVKDSADSVKTAIPLEPHDTDSKGPPLTVPQGSQESSVRTARGLEPSIVSNKTQSSRNSTVNSVKTAKELEPTTSASSSRSSADLASKNDSVKTAVPLESSSKASSEQSTNLASLSARSASGREALPQENEAPEHWLWTAWNVLTMTPLVPYVLAAGHPSGEPRTVGSYSDSTNARKPPSNSSGQ